MPKERYREENCAVDRTGERQVREALKERENFLEGIIESVQDGISVLDKDLTIRRVNRYMNQWYRDNLPLEGKKCYEAYHNRNKPCEPCPTLRCMESGETEHEIVAGLPGSPAQCLELYSYPFRNPDTGETEGVVEFVRDITERKRMEEELHKAQKLESVGFLAGGIAHDFNNLLMAIWGYVNLAKMETGAEGRALEYLGEAERACRRAKDLTEQLITFSKGGEPVRRPTSLAKVLRDTSTISLSGSSVRGELHVPGDLWSAEVDEGQIAQVLSNLCINAVQAMPEGGVVRIRAENALLTEGEEPVLKPGRYVKITVQDSGVGIQKENLPKIFDPYFTTKQAGSGLGLAVAYSITKKHEGQITVKSAPGRGTTFQVCLPACDTEPGEETSFLKELVPGEGRILVMDDEELVRNLVGQFLERLGYEAEFAEDGAQAVDLYRRALAAGRPHDAVILDLTVPGGMGGREAAKRILALDPKARIIVSSGYSNDPIMAEYEKSGFVDVIPKPYSMAPMSRILKRVVSLPR